MIYLYTLIASLLAAVLYRLGGTNAGTLWRDIGVPSCMLALMTITGHFHWTLILCFGLMYGSCTTYFGFINPWLKLGKKDKYWFNYMFHGMALGLSMLPYEIYSEQWFGFYVRLYICAVIIPLWSIGISKDWLEEGGRGFITIATIPLLLL